jgi:ferrous iron transport protein A
MGDAALLPLAFLPPGREVVVRGLAGGRGMRRRLTDMGIAPGAKVRVVRNDGHGPLLMALGEARLAVGRGVALKIMVEEV